MRNRIKWTKPFSVVLGEVLLLIGMAISLSTKESVSGPWDTVSQKEYFKQKVTLWADNLTDFRQTLARRYEALKFIGGGHVAGALSTATFLTSGRREGWIVIAAKACWFIFGIGLALFAAAYWQLYQTEADLEKAIEWSKYHKENPRSQEMLDVLCVRVVTRNDKFAFLVSRSIALFALGAATVFLGILIMGPPATRGEQPSGGAVGSFAVDRKMIRCRSRRPLDTELRAPMHDFANQRIRTVITPIDLVGEQGEQSGLNRTALSGGGLGYISGRMRDELLNESLFSTSIRLADHHG